MFGRKPPTAIGPQTTLRGTFECGEDDLVVAGRFEGTVSSDATVTVVEGGVIVGDVDARVVVVGGRIQGSVVARERLAMRPQGRIEGDARYESLEVERGGVIEGRAATLHEGPPVPLLEGAKASPVEETMRFTTPLAAQVVVDDSPSEDDDPGERRQTAITVPGRSGTIPGSRTTDTWGLGEPADPTPADEA